MLEPNGTKQNENTNSSAMLHQLMSSHGRKHQQYVLFFLHFTVLTLHLKNTSPCDDGDQVIGADSEFALIHFLDRPEWKQTLPSY